MKNARKNKFISFMFMGMSISAVALTLGALSNSALADDEASAGRTLLENRCLKCHGENGHYSGKFNLNDGVQALSDKGILIPGDPEHSLLYQKVRDQDMPADGNYLNAQELSQVSAWIQSLKQNAAVPTAVNGSLTDDEVVATIKNFLSTSNEGANYRIFSLVDLANQGKSANELEIYRQALAKTVNTLSLKKNLVKPLALDPNRLLLAVNMKDLGWDPQIWTDDFSNIACTGLHFRYQQADQNSKDEYSNQFETRDYLSKALAAGVKFCKKNEALTGVNIDGEDFLDNEFSEFSRNRRDISPCDEYAILNSVDQSVVARRHQDLDMSTCSVMPADAFIALATRQETYDTLVLAPLSGQRGQTVEGVLKAGFNQNNKGFLTLGLQSSGVALHNRVISRKEDFPGYYWASRDFVSDLDKEDLTRHPNAHPDAGEFIFSLPNGMQGYMIADSQDQLIAQAQTSIAINPARVDQVVSRPDSCLQCHGNIGIIPKGASEVIPHGFSDFNDVKPYFTSDSNNYQAALKQIGAYRSDSIEPVTYVLKNILSHDYK